MTATPPCRAFVAGFGKPGMLDLDFGRQVVDWLQQLDWPDEVVVEDLSCSVPLVLHVSRNCDRPRSCSWGRWAAASTPRPPCAATTPTSPP
ncbi:MAG: hypothetical protein ACR2KK_20030 [Acidimicrobiales bacterium]